MTELLKISHTMTLAWRYGASWYFAEFIRALRDEQRLLGLRCPICRRVYLPPRPVCGNCHAELREWVEVKDSGTVRAFTIVHTPIIDPTTGQPRPTPYGMALIQLDGADTTLNHYLVENEPAQLRIGMRVQAVWRAERKGTLNDIAHFASISPIAERDAQAASSQASISSLQSPIPNLHSPISNPQSLFITAGVNLSFNYAAGKAASRFLIALRDEKKIFGTRCPSCQRVLVPARSFCPRCFVDTRDWVEVGPNGTLGAFAATDNLAFALIRLDGADTALVHRVNVTNADELRIGLRVAPVFAETRRGHILDLAYFQPA